MRAPLLFVVALAACRAPRDTAPTGSGGERPRTGYSLHEWGLVRGGAGDTLESHAIGSGLPLQPVMVVLKPVLYFHLEGERLAIRSSRVTAVEGELREHWPLATDAIFPTAVDWGGFEVRAGACTQAFAPPLVTDPPCSVLPPGELCEATSLADAISPDADCLVRAGVPLPFLFYRSSTRGLTVPLRGVRLPNGDLEITNAGDLPIPGRIVRIQRSGGEERIVVVEPPAPHAAITIAVGGAGGDGPAAIGEALEELGMTRGEIEAFHRAWDGTLFSGPTAALDLSMIPTLDESIVYFLPPTLVEEIATVDLDPPPTEVHRAMAVWTSL
jgi:hypothetical protein